MDRRRKYDWRAVQRFYDAGNSFYRCMEIFGFSAAGWHKAKLRNEILVRPPRKPIEEVLRNPKNRTHVKGRLLREGFLKPSCSSCGISQWNGKPLSIQLDHINGINDDYSLENLRMLCPNCHSLTDTYGNRKRKER